MTKRSLSTIAILALPLGLAGCGGDDASHSAQATVTVTTTVTPEPTEAAESQSAEANVGDLALKVGEWREGTGIRTRIIKVQQPGQGGMPSYLRGDAEASGATVLARSCVREGDGTAVLSNFDFTARDKNGAVYDASGSSWEVWPPLPQYPVEREAAGGECVQGWILISAPEKTRITSVELSGEDGVVAEWLVS